MNFLQSPPTHYPNAHDSTLEVFRTRNFSVNEPPAYGAERAPPQYQEATEAEVGEQNDPKARAKARRTRYIRILTSVLIVTTVALIVAGVVGKISKMKGQERETGDRDDAEEASSAAEPAMTSATIVLTADEAVMTPTPTVTASESSTSEDNNPAGKGFERGQGVLETPVRVWPVGGTNGGKRPVCGASFHEPRAPLEEAPPVDDPGYMALDCLLDETSYQDHAGKLEHRCVGSCEQNWVEAERAEGAKVDQWELGSG